jgi:hypothetical protein
MDSIDWYERLSTKYPRVCGENRLCHIAVGDGWMPFIETAIHKLEQLCKRKGQIKLCQVKEKFGELRLYTSIALSPSNPRFNSLHEKVREIEKEAEALSRITCEHCGSREHVSSKGRPYWIMTLCESCDAVIQKERENAKQKNKTVSPANSLDGSANCGST